MRESAERARHRTDRWQGHALNHSIGADRLPRGAISNTITILDPLYTVAKMIDD